MVMLIWMMMMTVMTLLNLQKATVTGERMRETEGERAASHACVVNDADGDDDVEVVIVVIHLLFKPPKDPLTKY